MTPELLTITAAARYLSLCRTSIYKLVEQGDLHVVRLLPDAPRIRRTELDALVAARVAEAERPPAAA